MNEGVKTIYDRVLNFDPVIRPNMGLKRTINECEDFTRYVLSAFIADRADKNFFEALKDLGYYECPAAKSHHSNYKGGLFVHSVEVARQLLLLTDGMNLTWEHPGSPIIIGMLHDICKVRDYVYDFGHNNIEFTPTMEIGHGTKSLMILGTMLRLTKEESYCIRYHMGAYSDKSEWKFFDEAIRTYPNVFWTHTADMVASKISNK